MQKGLKDTDIVSLLSEGFTEVTFSVCHPNCEKYTQTKTYRSEEEYKKSFEKDFADYRDSWKNEKFDFESTSGTEVEESDDSWGSLASDVFGSLKTKLFGSNSSS